MIGDITFYPNYFHYVGFDAENEPSLVGQGYACSGAETSGAIYDVVDLRRDNIITIDTDGETNDAVLDMELTSTITDADFFIVDNHNLETADANIKGQYGVGPNTIGLSSAYSGAFNSALTSETITSNEVMNPTDGILLALFTSATSSSRFLLSTTEDSPSYDADITIGEWFVGKKCAPSKPANVDFSEGYENGGVIVSRSAGGIKYGFQRYTPKRFWRLVFEHLTATDVSNLKTLWLVTGGQLRPFYVDLGESATPQLYLVRFAMDRMEFMKEGTLSWRLTIQLEEE